jgi:hypothetical protein
MARCTWWYMHEDEKQRGSTTVHTGNKKAKCQHEEAYAFHTKPHFQGLFWTRCDTRNIHFLSSEYHAMFLRCLVPPTAKRAFSEETTQSGHSLLRHEGWLDIDIFFFGA